MQQNIYNSTLNIQFVLFLKSELDEKYCVNPAWFKFCKIKLNSYQISKKSHGQKSTTLVTEESKLSSEKAFIRLNLTTKVRIGYLKKKIANIPSFIMASPVEEEDNPTSLHWVIKSSNFGWQEIKEHLNQGFYYVEELDSERRTPLFTAVERPNCSYETVRVLLQNKACVERVDGNGRTPLIVAMENKNCPISVLQVLLYYGSKINHRSVFKLLV